MLLQYHLEILIRALYLLHTRIDNHNLTLNLLTDIIPYTDNISNVELIQSKTIISINDNKIRELFKGLLYPDLPCAYFYIQHIRNKGQIIPELRLCPYHKFEMVSYKNEVSSQMNESHNEYYSFNHSMSKDISDSNKLTRKLILRRLIALATYFIDNNDYSFLGYIIHIIQDSWSNG